MKLHAANMPHNLPGLGVKLDLSDKLSNAGKNNHITGSSIKLHAL